MKVYLIFLVLFLPFALSAQIEFEDQGFTSESDMGRILMHIISDRPGGPPLLSVTANNPNGLTASFGAPAASAIQGVAQQSGNAITGFAQGGYGIKGRSGTNFGAYISSTDYHGAYFLGDKLGGYADIVLGATVEDNNGTIMSDPDVTGSNLFVAANHAVVAKIDKNKNGEGSFLVQDGLGCVLFQVDINGNVKVNNSTVHGSDRNRKEQINTVSYDSILNAIIEMPIYEWQYKKEDRRHIGPMAQDFHKAFGLGDDDKSIAAIDADGVALAAVKAQQVMIEKQAEQLKIQSEQIALLIKEVRAIKSQ